MRLFPLALLLVPALGPSAAAQTGFAEEFDQPQLNARWEWFVPKAGPTISLTDNPGHLRLTVPAEAKGYNHWTGYENATDAPLLLTPAPAGDFTLESHVRMVSFDPEGNFHFTLTVAFSKRYLVGWGPYYSPLFGTPRGVPQVWCEPTGQGHFLADDRDAHEAYLRVVKSGHTYTFSTRSTPDEDWRVTGHWESAFEPAAVGFMGKTFGDRGPVVCDIDSLRVTPRESSVAPTPISRIQVQADAPTWPLDRRRLGTFIENLARCIDGGVWAELLHNRKFTGKVSAQGVVEGWEPAALRPGVRLARDNEVVYCGSQSQRVELPGAATSGIRQTVELRAGIPYVVRLVGRQEGLSAPVRVALQLGRDVIGEAEIAGLTDQWSTHEVSLQGPAATGPATFSITATGPGKLWLGAVSLMPGDNVDGLRGEVVQAIREMRMPMIRWPGGNFVSQHDWRDAIGPRDKRPPRWNRAWNQWEWNDLGTDEFLRLCELTGVEPYICVNCGEGQATEAAAWVEYCNGPATSTWGKLRAANGHPAPYGVKLWSLGNEMWGSWQHGTLNATNYGLKALELARAMRAVDPTIELIGDGVPTHEFGDWNRELCPILAPEMDLLSVHFYQPCADNDDPAYNYAVILGAAGYVEGMLAQTCQIAAEASGKPMPLAFDEWNVTPSGPQCLRNSLFHCLVFNAMHRLGPKVPVANLALLINIFGTLDVTPTSTVRSAGYWAFHMYDHNTGDLGMPVRVQDGPRVQLPGAPNLQALDAVASLSADRKQLFLNVVNRLHDEAAPASLDLGGFDAADRVRVVTLDAATPETLNTPAQPDAVRLAEREITLPEARAFRFAPHSATTLVFAAR